MMQKVLITGATGFVGRALARKMVEAGWTVKGVLRRASDSVLLPAGVDGVRLDALEDCRSLAGDLLGVETVIHLAACVHGSSDSSACSLDAFRRINAGGTESLARLCAQARVRRFVFLSSVKVNGEGNIYPYTENDIPDPRGAYAISKWEAEQALGRIARETGLPTVILRSPLVYGPGVKANFKSLIKLAGSGLPLPFKGIHNRRSFIYLGNLVDVLMVCATHPEAVGETFMVSDGQDLSSQELVKQIAILLNKRPIMFSVPEGLLKTLAGLAGRREAMEKMTGSLTVNMEKIRHRLGWSPPFTLEEGMRETLKEPLS